MLLVSLVVALLLVNDVQSRPVAARGASMTALLLEHITHGALRLCYSQFHLTVESHFEFDQGG